MAHFDIRIAAAAAEDAEVEVVLELCPADRQMAFVGFPNEKQRGLWKRDWLVR